jgi:threonine dehydrogenase-like Zn-dependent dehydrogenase
MIIKSACLTGVRKIKVEKRELILSDDQVLVKTHAAGICGSDKNRAPYHSFLSTM